MWAVQAGWSHHCVLWHLNQRFNMTASVVALTSVILVLVGLYGKDHLSQDFSSVLFGSKCRLDSQGEYF